MMKLHLTSRLLPLLMLCPATAGAEAWMGRLPDNAYIDQLSIPGTHDSATGNGVYGTPFADSFGRTQTLNIHDQLEAGVRAFDLRPAVDTDGYTLRIYHGILATNLTFEQAMNQLFEFLEQNPTEFIVAVMRHESDRETDEQKQRWGDLMHAWLANCGHADRLAQFSPDLTVADMRGKLLLISRDGYTDGPAGAYISGWNHGADFAQQGSANIYGPAGSAKAHVQDIYDTSGDGKATKIDMLHRVLDFSTSLADASAERKWVINHTSGYRQTIAWVNSNSYRDNATFTNPTVIDYLAAKTGPTGLVMMDHAGVDETSGYAVRGRELVNAIIDNNFKYTPRCRPTVTISHAEHGNITVKQGSTVIESGTAVPEGASLTVTAQPDESYELGAIRVNGEILTGNRFKATGNMTVSATFHADAGGYAVGPWGRSDAAPQRHINSLTLTGGEQPECTIESFDTADAHEVYANCTDRIFTAKAGSRVRLGVNSTGNLNWIHGYVYADFDGDRTFTPAINSATGRPEAGSELLAYSYYGGPDEAASQSGRDSSGALHSGNGSNRAASLKESGRIPAFTLPRNLRPGDYRMRFKMDWNSIDPCGNDGSVKAGDAIDVTGGYIIDFTLRVPDPETAIAELPADAQGGIRVEGNRVTSACGGMEIFDAAGRRVIHTEASESDISSLGSGAYIVRSGNASLKIRK